MLLCPSLQTTQAEQSLMRAMPGELMLTGHHNSGCEASNSVQFRSNLCEDQEQSCSKDHVQSQVMPTHVIGIVLADVRIFDATKSNTSEHFYVLGVILLDSLDIIVEELRKTMCAQVESLPGAFSILTKQGWPLSRHQENKVHISHVLKENHTVMIRKHFERPPVGVITTLGESLGFLFIDPQWSIYQLREAINEQVMEKRRTEYRFIERNGWPVATHQETILSVLDVLRIGYNICIQYGDNRLNFAACLDEKRIPVTTPTKLPESIRKPKTTMIGKDNKKPSKKKKETLVAKPILISYVRAEAAAHALHLKEGLAKLGFSVYLDVHEIKTGSDWQDALNYAVSNCQFFVPLITPMYGKTQWTNREVKLADVLGKNIIPISFLEQWPPECLAIQFASTQYIPWKPQESDHARSENDSKPSDTRIWDQIYIKRVCKELSERCKTTKKKATENEKGHDNPSIAIYGRTVAANQPRHNENNLVVISGHPKQRILIHQIKVTLEIDGYDVWCSSDLQEYPEAICFEDNLPPSASTTPRKLTSISEGFSVFGQTYQEIATTIADSKRGSAHVKEAEDRKQLTRMISQVSDISQVSSLTPDKMERLRTFQQKTDQAGVVIIIVSDAYTKSKTSQQQVFYCEHRKHVVLVKFDQSALPSWFTMLMGNDMITNIQSAQFINTLKSQVKRATNPSSSETPKDATAEAKIQCLVNFMQKSVPQPETCIYIAGSSKLQYSRSEEIARAIGKELARIKNITLCTGGFFGAQEIVAKTFYESVQNNKEIIDADSNERIVHLLPFKDTKDFSSKAHQNADGSFESIDYGKTCFAGDSVKERETAVARLFDTCIVIEGGPGAAHEVEEFIWNDHFVIPIISTGGAAGGQYGVPLKIFEAPPCVSECDWQILSEKEAKPENVAEAVVNIVVALKQSIVSHDNSQMSQTTEGVKTKIKMRTRSRKSKIQPNHDQNKTLQVLRKDETVQTQTEETTHYSHGHRLLQRQVASYSVTNGKYKYATRWQRFLRLFSSSKIS